MDLEEVLNDEPKQEPEGSGRETSARAQFKAKEREAQEAGKVEVEPKVEPKPEPKVETPPPEQEMTPKEKAAFSKAAEEVRKRQQREQELSQAHAEIARLRQAPPQPQEPPKPFLEDPEGGFTSLSKRVDQTNAEFRQEMANSRMATSEMIARHRYPDFEEKMAAFREIVGQAPHMMQQCATNLDPAEFAYNVAKSHLDLKAAGDLPTLRANLEKEIRLKVEQEYKEKQEAQKKERALIPPSLSDARGVTQKRVVWSGPPSMDSVLND